jgi:hypothetical protein
VTVKPDKVIRAGEWELKIYYRRCTPIEYQHGVLRRRGRLVRGRCAGQEIDTPLGLLRYYGQEETCFLTPTGWNFADRRQIRRSWSEGLAAGRQS